MLPATTRATDPVETATCFLRLENFNPAKLDLIGRYETRLWRQLAQTILLIDSAKRGKFTYRTHGPHIFFVETVIHALENLVIYARQTMRLSGSLFGGCQFCVSS